MALTRPWYCRGNIPMPDTSSALNTMKSIQWLIKACLMQQVTTGTLGSTGALPASGAWACTGSSNSVAAGMDGVDRWGATFDATKIVRGNGAVAKSWIVLRHTTLGVSCCVTFDGSADTSASVHFAYTEFSGGTTTARPTSANEFVVVNSTSLHNGNAVNHNFHFSVDAAGNFYMHCGQVGAGFVNLALWGAELAEARPSDTRKFFGAYSFNNSGRGAPGVANTTVNGRTIGNGANITGGIMRVTFGGQTFGGTMEANAADSAFDTLPAAVGCNNAGQSGIRGRYPDVTFGGLTNISGSDPTTGTQERADFGDYQVPMPGLVPAM